MTGVFSGDVPEAATATTFGVECGCDGVANDDATGVVSSTPASSTSSSPDAVASPDGCAEASVSVTSSEFPLLEGCLVETDIFEGGEIEYVGGDAALIYADNSEGEMEVRVRAGVRFLLFSDALLRGCDGP